MQVYRPRESILSLFDPLAGGQSTPDRNTPSPDASSDKENDGPGPVTVFFNRAYTQPASCTVKTPIGKLIDFAETPYHGSDDEDWDESLLDEDGEDMMGAEDGTMTGRLIDKLRSERENEHILSSSLNSPQTPSDRRPLADIRLESSLDGVPVFSKLSSPQSIHTPSPSPTSPQFTANKQPPSEHSLSGIIHSINLSANQPSPSVNGLGGNHQEDAENSMQVEIMVCPPDSVPQSPVVSSYPSPALLNPRTPLVSSPSVTSPSLSAASRRLQVNTSSSDPRRTSVDLYSSFSMQIQSPDMSFDLLNDKISFLGLGHDSFLNGGDDTLDFQKQREIGAIPEEVEKKEQDLVISKVSAHSSPCSDKTDTPSTPASRPAVFSLPPAKKTAISRHSLPVDDADEVKADGEAPPLVTKPDMVQLREATLPQVAPQEKATMLDGSEPTTSIPPPSNQPVPALRIVKKSWKMHDTSLNSAVPSRSSSRASTSSSTSCSSHSEAISAKSTPDAPKLTGEPTKTRPIIRGVQRPPPGAQLPHVQVSKPRLGGVPSTLTKPTARSASGALSGPVRPTTASRPTEVQRRIASSSTTASVVRNPSILRPPTSATSGKSNTIGFSSIPSRPPTSSTRSGLPLPQSRLPAPSGSSGIPVPGRRAVSSSLKTTMSSRKPF